MVDLNIGHRPYNRNIKPEIS